ncbi:hypothetical protein BV25DRAFT_1917866 [Artomyces pyxidatus]|uniref:Uncharacterized protein n=1 Tax=Artomyces pyxidatus TaxID=48021 RepID=A0ACB8SUW0_9AGAM|nr:hypothetical protein BV25DRAFT_1917866 [Artomyces pyxidatus]
MNYSSTPIISSTVMQPLPPLRLDTTLSGHGIKHAAVFQGAAVENVTPVRSPSHYYEDGTLVLQVGGKLYKLYVPVLRKRSRVFADMFTLPPTTPLEGTSDESPVILYGIIDSEFDCLMDFMWGSTLPEVEDPRPQAAVFFCSILKLSTLWDIPDGRAYAILHLNEYPDGWNVFRKLACAFQYRVSEWLPVALRTILSLPHSYIMGPQATDLGLPLFWKISYVRAEIDVVRKTLAYEAPPFAASLMCEAEDLCSVAWSTAWSDSFSKMLVHPDEPKSGRDVLQKLEEFIGSVPDLCEHCHALTVQAIKDSGNLIRGEEEIIEKTIESLQRGSIE